MTDVADRTDHDVDHELRTLLRALIAEDDASHDIADASVERVELAVERVLSAIRAENEAS